MDKLAVMYWADKEARKVVELSGDKKKYVCASGITPSGLVHIGNFREIITVNLVVEALQDLGKKVKFIYSWDSFDRLRKIPQNIPEKKRKEMEDYIGMPVWDAIDPYGCHKNYALHFMTPVIEDVAKMGIKPEFLNQAELYRKCIYAEGIREALRAKNIIADIMNPYRKELLSEEWYPANVYCEKCGKDFTKIARYNGEYTLSYKCKCGNENEIDFRKKGIVKLKWRTDWPMRWAYYEEDFEPGGKDHFIAGSSYDTGKQIIKNVYSRNAPYGFMYEFVSIKGGPPGKMSKSIGNVYSISDVLKVYTPEVIRYMFAGTKPLMPFAISMDADAIKEYEDFYKHERVYFDKEEVNERDTVHMKRVYEMSAIDLPKSIPIQPSFRLIADTLQTYKTKEKASDYLVKNKLVNLKNAADEKRLSDLFDRAEVWLEKYAPESLKYSVSQKVQLNDREKEIVSDLAHMLEKKKYSRDQLVSAIFDLAKKQGMKEFFPAVYKALFNKDRGPKLAEYIYEYGQNEVVDILNALL